MIRWMSNDSLKNDRSFKELRNRMGTTGINDELNKDCDGLDMQKK